MHPPNTWQTKDGKPIIRRARGDNVHVRSQSACSDEEKVLLEQAGLLLPRGALQIERRQRRRYLLAAQQALEAAGYTLDIRCRHRPTWVTADGQWLLERHEYHFGVASSSQWTITSANATIELPNGKWTHWVGVPRNKRFRTRDEAVEWGQRHLAEWED